MSRHAPVVLQNALIILLLGVAAAAALLTAPTDGDFYWSDAPRHALNGLFVKDLLTDLPFFTLRQYAVDYYLRYPALTILFYPPGFYGALAAFYALFGESHFTAQLAVAVFFFLFLLAAWRLAARWLGTLGGAGAALLFASAPEILLWARQVMIDIPAHALLIASVAAFLRFLDLNGQNDLPRATHWLFAALLLFAASVWIKLNTVFLLPVFLITWAVAVGTALLRDRRFWIAAVLLTVLLAPLVAMVLLFGQGNIQSVEGRSGVDLPLFSLQAWSYYLRQMPAQLGWPTVAAATLFLLLACLRRLFPSRWRRPDILFMVLWFGFGYLFFTMIGIRLPRHDLFILFPVALAAAGAITLLFGSRRGGLLLLLFGIGSYAYTTVTQDVPRVGGYRQAAERIAAIAPRDAVILFSGYRDGSFIYNLRLQPRRDIAVLRADKLFLRVAIERRRGVQDLNLNPLDIRRMLSRYGVSYIVIEPGFWSDLPSMAALEELLKGRGFALVEIVPIEANVFTQAKSIRIYRNLAPVADGQKRIDLDVPTIGRRLQGRIRDDKNRP